MGPAGDSEDDLPPGKAAAGGPLSFYKAGSAGYAFNHNYWPSVRICAVIYVFLKSGGVIV